MGHEHIKKRIRTSGGESAYIGNSRIRVSHIAEIYSQMLDDVVAERIQDSLPHLTLEEVHAALAYWREHPDEIAMEIQQDREALERIPSQI
jgi:uncharacterized protein (DUF433 family)